MTFAEIREKLNEGKIPSALPSELEPVNYDDFIPGSLHNFNATHYSSGKFSSTDVLIGKDIRNHSLVALSDKKHVYMIEVDRELDEEDVTNIKAAVEGGSIKDAVFSIGSRNAARYKEEAINAESKTFFYENDTTVTRSPSTNSTQVHTLINDVMVSFTIPKQLSDSFFQGKTSEAVVQSLSDEFYERGAGMISVQSLKNGLIGDRYESLVLGPSGPKVSFSGKMYDVDINSRNISDFVGKMVLDAYSERNYFDTRKTVAQAPKKIDGMNFDEAVDKSVEADRISA